MINHSGGKPNKQPLGEVVAPSTDCEEAEREFIRGLELHRA